MHAKVLPPHSVELLKRLRAEPAAALGTWVLAGGTGLALQLGHRVSEDLDFFRTDAGDVRYLHPVLERLGPYETLQEADHTLTALTLGVKVSFFRVRDPFVFPTHPYRGFALADRQEIALMKLAAVSGRGSRKDFVDLYTILRDGPTLADYFALLPRKYGRSRVNTYHILKSLTYFADAEAEPLPRMRVPFDWKECKAFFVREAHGLVLG